MPQTRFKLIVEVHLILRREGRILMLRRFQTGYMDGHYSLVAGHVDGGEPFSAAMIREAREEAGITLVAEDLSLVHSMHKNGPEERLSLFFEASRWTGQIRNMEPHKCDDLDWYTYAEKETAMVPYVRAALSHIAQGAPYSEFDW